MALRCPSVRHYHLVAIHGEAMGKAVRDPFHVLQHLRETGITRLQGLGAVGWHLAEFLHQAGAQLVVADVDAAEVAMLLVAPDGRVALVVEADGQRAPATSSEAEARRQAQTREHSRINRDLGIREALAPPDEAGAAPFTVNGMTPLTDYVTPEARLYQGATLPSVYRAVDALPSAAVLAELPLGQPDYDLRAMFYSTHHWRRLVKPAAPWSPSAKRPIPSDRIQARAAATATRGRFAARLPSA